jgi:hypothetical protein
MESILHLRPHHHRDGHPDQQGQAPPGQPLARAAPLAVRRAASRLVSEPAQGARHHHGGAQRPARRRRSAPRRPHADRADLRPLVLEHQDHAVLLHVIARLSLQIHLPWLQKSVRTDPSPELRRCHAPLETPKEAIRPTHGEVVNPREIQGIRRLRASTHRVRSWPCRARASLHGPTSQVSILWVRAII